MHTFSPVVEKNKGCARSFFLATLCISNDVVLHAFSGRSEHNTFISGDMRGHHEPKHKLSAERLQFIKDHIKSFPLAESHFFRADTNRKYLQPGLNLVKMHELYKQKCEEQQLIPVKCQTYKKIFSSEFNIGFHSPSKDQCLQCEIFKTTDENRKLDLQENYDQHIKIKEDAQTKKKEDKAEAARDPSFMTATFDLQSVRQLPTSDVSSMYYKRKSVCLTLQFMKQYQELDTATCGASWMEKGVVQKLEAASVTTSPLCQTQ